MDTEETLLEHPSDSTPPPSSAAAPRPPSAGGKPVATPQPSRSFEYDAPLDGEISGASLFAERPQIPYILPIVVFVAFMLPAKFGHAFGLDWKSLWFNYLPAVYTAKTLAAALLLAMFWRYYTPIRWSHFGLAVAVGLIGLVQWVGLEFAVQHIWHYWMHAQTVHYPRLFGGQNAKNYNPITQIHGAAKRWLFYIVRIGGPTLVVPVMEELFWRDFVWRALQRGARFKEVPIGVFTWLALVGSSLLFSTGHFQWPSAIVWGLLIGWLLIRTKSIGACIIAHATTNLTLGIYVLMTHQWQFW